MPLQTLPDYLILVKGKLHEYWSYQSWSESSSKQ